MADATDLKFDFWLFYCVSMRGTNSRQKLMNSGCMATQPLLVKLARPTLNVAQKVAQGFPRDATDLMSASSWKGEKDAS
jgi:hypothetical protein